MAKPKVAFFEFADCEGCQLCAIDLTPEELLDLLNVVDIVEFREAISEKSDTYDVAIVEGSITRQSDVARLKKIRETAAILVALGSCAHIAGINALKNFQSKSEYQQAVYPDDPTKYETDVARPLHEIVPVDAFIPGCPIDTQEFLRVVKNVVLGKAPGIPDYPVCVECKQKENVCVYEKGIQCLGPVIRAGCGARCPSNGGYCFGCRGIIPEPNINSQQDIMQKYDLTFEQMKDKFKLFLERNKEVFPDA
ncbi:NADH:ubiquinone oxidoreductase [candidate division KSB3 bacterium]|uniref:NADH:ubiquinone oxidoreductase n=1 Tax=candidate division KSB3 bacterium TaxID=2044937 RepID=A0A9D5JYT3_9BACT|nr:NADH:ubiquinone oxidoreductase [candidate division KSB3 bacterium]MBD3326665.1 NADH:ubiquinone oxidoreductase [candidate division KSB3 bacterium]